MKPPLLLLALTGISIFSACSTNAGARLGNQDAGVNAHGAAHMHGGSSGGISAGAGGSVSR